MLFKIAVTVAVVWYGLPVFAAVQGVLIGIEKLREWN